MRITLEITAGPEAGRKVWLGEQQAIVIGRTELSEFSVPGDTLLSSIHFQVAWKDGGFRLRDLKSTNGTKLNGEQVQETALQNGDVILAGKTKFAVFIDADAAVSPDKLPTAPSSHIPLADARSASAVTDTRVGARTEAKLRESITLPAPSGSHGTLVFNTPVRVTADSEPAEEDTDEPTSLLVVDNRTRFSVACLPWRNAEGAGRLTVIVKATLRFSESEIHVADRQWPISFADQHEDDDPLKPVRFEADTAPFKPRTDVVLVGKAYAPGGRARASVDVRLRVGGLNKRLRVFGDRKWLFPTRLAVVPQMTDPIPFTEMPLNYSRAYGGIDEAAARYCAENLCGVGFIGEPAPASIHNKPLPNIEDPDHLIGAWDSRPKPVGFGFYGRGWQPRLKHAGTYDDAYRRSKSTGVPADFGYELYNGAHPDLQVAGYLDGDELVELENVTRDGYAKFTLPGIRPTITIARHIASPETRAESQIKKERPVKPFLDAVVFVPDERVVYEVFRAVFSVRDIENPDIAEIRVE
jgi:hypothetical protein